jgi:M61 glycyl aminopeptidase
MMRGMPLSRVWIAIPFLVSAAAAFELQQTAPQPAPAALNWDAGDAKRIDALTARGERREGTHVVLVTPAGALADAEEQALLARLDQGNRELRAIVGRHDWQVMKAEKITYYISEDRFVSHASGRGAVFIPLARVQDGRAPFLHEAGHELLATFSRPLTPEPGRFERVRAKRPLWLAEGLADYVGQTAATRAGVKEGDVFDIGGLEGADAACRERLKGPRGSEILPFIGALGAPEALFTTDRQQVAPTFYACGTSFTKFVVGRIGLPETIGLMPRIADEGVLPRIEQLTGKPMDAVRAEWRQAIGVP